MTSILFKAKRALLAVGVSMIAAACARQAPQQLTAVVPTDYKDRHPIVVAPAEEGIDIFMRGVSGRLDQRQTLELKAVADDYRKNGQGRIAILVPTGAHGSSHRGAAAVRGALASAGVQGLAQSSYRVEGPATDQPIRVVYTKLKARVATKCGQWPEDIAGFQGTRSWNNESYYNFGCSYQNALAAQVDDPLDLIRGRTEDPSDTARRVAAIGAAREGKDTSTNYRATSTKINQVVGAE